MTDSLEVFKRFLRRGHRWQFGRLDLSHGFSTRQVEAQEGSLWQGSPTWRYRVLKTALGLRPRRALSSASGQSSILAQGARKENNFKFFLLTNHIPVFRGSPSGSVPFRFSVVKPHPCNPVIRGSQNSRPPPRSPCRAGVGRRRMRSLRLNFIPCLPSFRVFRVFRGLKSGSRCPPRHASTL